MRLSNAARLRKLIAETRKLNEIGRALSSERDMGRLLALILTSARDLIGCDAGSLYLVQKKPGGPVDLMRFLADKQLYFKLAQNDSIQVPFREFPLEITRRSIAGYAALTGKPLNIPDVYRIPAAMPYTFARSFDEKTGYRTVSMLTVPMTNQRGELLGVIQLINRRRAGRPLGRKFALHRVLPFDKGSVDLAMSLASQACVGIENDLLYEEIRGLLDGFVRASVVAIEARDPTTSGHSERVAKLTADLARKVDRENRGPYQRIRFTREHLRQIEYASLLHDFGKIGVREEVLVKAKKLYPWELDRIERRAREVRLGLQLAVAQEKLNALSLNDDTRAQVFGQLDRDLAQEMKKLDEDLETIRRANNPTVLEDGSFDRIRELSRQNLAIPGCDILTLLDEREAGRLLLRRGSLSEEERKEIESHVTHSFHFLRRIPWSRDLARVPEFAYAHHEKMNGKGYPRSLAGGTIPLESRMMTIADIYDALTAWDRPYKKAVPPEKALDILKEEAKSGALDPELLRIFIDTKVYEAVGRPPAASV